MAQSIIGWMEFLFVQINVLRAFPRGDNDELVKLQWRNLKVVFSTGPISTKLGTKYLWVKEKWRATPFPKGNNWEIININWQLLKNFFTRTTGPISTKLSTRHPWVKEILVCSKEGPHLFPKGDNYEKAKHIDEIKKSSPPEPPIQFQPNMAQGFLGWRGFKSVQMKGLFSKGR